KYSERRIKDRLTFDMVGEYCLNFGIHLFDPDYYESGYIIEKDPLPNAKLMYEYPNLKQV
ncbi:MAG: hypothetical protein LBO79_06180, partial [Zoogloeaceae bacterium]|nr:hypothetical protein [Zoogloeaceae bacterium]